MLKRISVQELVVGMHIKEFCGSWMDHPFLRTGFVLSDPKDLQRIRATRIKEVWIDSAKGLDLPAAESAPATAKADTQVPQEAAPVVPPPQEGVTVPMAVEVERASKICQQSKLAVMSMFKEARMGKAVDTASAHYLVEEISDSVARNASALISLARIKTVDEYTYMHSVAVCALMIALARQLNLNEAQTRSAGMAGLMHDLGKAVMPHDILSKPSDLTQSEFAIMKSHPEEGHRMLLAVGNMDPITLDVCLHHHEKIDGTGYPKGLKGDEISLFAKMGAVCDVYDAITSNRPYRTGADPAETVHHMAKNANGHFDDMVFKAFVKCLGIYPVGSLVRLTSGRLGVVVEQTSKSLTTPRVKVFFSTKSDLRIPPVIIDLSVPNCPEKIAGREDPAKWNFPDLEELWSGLQLPKGGVKPDVSLIS